MSADRLGRGFEDLPLEEWVRAPRDQAIGQGLLITVLLIAVERLEVRFNWGDEDDRAIGYGRP